jgi:hypothetical protein
MRFDPGNLVYMCCQDYRDFFLKMMGTSIKIELCVSKVTYRDRFFLAFPTLHY